MVSLRIRFVVLSLFVSFCCGCAGHPNIQYKLDHRYGVDDPQFQRSLGNLLGPSLISGNKITAYRNGDEAFPAMLAAIRDAKRNIDLETFIYWKGDIGSQFTDALADRARAGVAVHVVIDAIGSGAQIDSHYFKTLRDAGATVENYHPVAWYNLSKAARINHRTHRKLLIIDGRVGFTGGMGIADEWTGHAQDPDHWRDMHYRLDGPAVLQLQSAFCDNWMKTTGEVLDGEDYFPEISQQDGLPAQVFKSDAAGGSESMQLMFLLSIAAAEKNVRLATAYFVPDDLTVRTICEAAKRGVHVQILVPGPHLDVKIVRPASRATWGRMLEAGVEIYEYQPTMYHTKLLIIDDRWTSIGSANMDDRSFKLNDEANVNVLDRDFGITEAKVYDEDLKAAKQYRYEDWKHRSFGARLSEGLADLFSPLL